jgi:Ion channel
LALGLFALALQPGLLGLERLCLEFPDKLREPRFHAPRRPGANWHVDAQRSGTAKPQRSPSLCLSWTGAGNVRRPAWSRDQGVARRRGRLGAPGDDLLRRFEDWTIIEALYFSIATLTTVGYGDFSPTSAGTQIFTIIYILTGFGVLVALLTSVAQQYLRHKAEVIRCASVWARRHRDN